ncbi:MAG: hypothetical protein EBU37_07700, partial [Actinobacteria bacterium]|nr:hypothetical protein [Actinomycetota bacterium]
MKSAINKIPQIHERVIGATKYRSAIPPMMKQVTVNKIVEIHSEFRIWLYLLFLMGVILPNRKRNATKSDGKNSPEYQNKP